MLTEKLSKVEPSLSCQTNDRMENVEEPSEKTTSANAAFEPPLAGRFLSNDNCLFLLQGPCTKPKCLPSDQVPVASLVGPLRLGGIVPQFLPTSGV
jgi:hypothetical protein